MKISKQPLLIALVLYLVSAAVSYGAFSQLGGERRASVSVSEPSVSEDGSEEIIGSLLEIDTSMPRDQVCPLNGAYYTQVERDAWEQRRPLAVMIENTPDSRPQSGISDADIVFEAVAEGGVTRFMAMYYCDVQAFDTTLAPIRSARTYYIDYASGFNRPLYTHVGGANVPGPTDALGQLSEYGWTAENALNQFSIGFPTFVRDYNRLPGKEIATEHTMVTTTEALWEVAEERGWTNTPPKRLENSRSVSQGPWQEAYEGWTFQEEDPADGDVTTVAYDFWTGYDEYAVEWQYDVDSKMFMRSQGGEAHVDLNNDDQVKAANVVVLLTTEQGPINEKKHMLYDTTGTGDALIFKNGDVIEATWSKRTRTDELRFTDARGQDIPMARGLTWISVVSDVTEVAY